MCEWKTVTKGALTVGERMILHSNDSHTAQLMARNNASQIAELHVRKVFRSGTWYHISFPFNIDAANMYINREGESVQRNISLNPNTDGTGRGVWAKYYCGESRAKADSDPNHQNAENGANWKIRSANEQLKANTAYQFGHNYGTSAGKQDTITFVCVNPSSNLWNAVDDWNADTHYEPTEYGVKYHHASYAHCGWNLIGNPYIFNYHLTECQFPYITYLYDEPVRDYREDTDIIEPFKAFFIQVDEGKEGVLFDHGDKTMNHLRSLSASPYEQIRLSFTADNSFYDYFNLRTGGEGATTGYDFNRDAHKILSATSPQLYSNYYGSDYAINAIPDTEGSVPLAYKAPQAGTYTIRLDADRLSENITKLLLLDRENANRVTDLLATPSYEFTTAGAQASTTRFELLFELFGGEVSQPTVLDPSAEAGDELKVIYADGQLTLYGLNALSTVETSDLSGPVVNFFLLAVYLPAAARRIDGGME